MENDTSPSAESETLDLLPEELRKKLEATHGEIVAVKTKAGVAVFRLCKEPELERYQDLQGNKATSNKSASLFVKTLVVHPDKKVFEAWVSKYPGIAITCLNPVLAFCGVEVDAEKKEYGNA